VCVSVCVCVWCVCVYIHIHVDTYTYIYTYVYVCRYTCTNIYIYIDIGQKNAQAHSYAPSCPDYHPLAQTFPPCSHVHTIRHNVCENPVKTRVAHRNPHTHARIHTHARTISKADRVTHAHTRTPHKAQRINTLVICEETVKTHVETPMAIATNGKNIADISPPPEREGWNFWDTSKVSNQEKGRHTQAALNGVLCPWMGWACRQVHIREKILMRLPWPPLSFLADMAAWQCSWDKRQSKCHQKFCNSPNFVKAQRSCCMHLISHYPCHAHAPTLSTRLVWQKSARRWRCTNTPTMQQELSAHVASNTHTSSSESGCYIC